MIDLEDIDAVPVADLPATIARLAALQARAAMRLEQAHHEPGADCECYDADAVAALLKCSVDLVRAKGETWGIARVLARDKAGRASRVTYPRALVHAYLVAGTREND